MADTAPGFTPSQLSNNANGTAPLPAPAAAIAPKPVEQHTRTEAKPPTPFLEDVQAQLPAQDVEPANDNAEPVIDPDDAPDPWAEKLYDKLTAKELIEKLKADTLLPEDLLDVLEHEFVFGSGETEERQRMSLKDALDQSHKERMQLKDYSRRRHELHQAQLDLSAKAASMQEAINGLNNPQTMFDDLIGLGVSEETLFAAAQQFAIQQVQLQKMPPEMRQMIAEQRKLRAEYAQTQRQLRELKARERTTQEEAHDRQARTVVQQHGTAALQKFKLNPASPLVKAKFSEHALALAGGKALTREVLYQAAEATSQDIHALEREDKATQAARSNGKPLGVRPAAAPAALKVPAQQNGKNRGYTASELAALRNR